MSDQMHTARSSAAGFGTWMLELIDETHRVTPKGGIGIFLSTLSVIATLIISYYALFAHATQHFQIAVFLVLLLPICFLTTTLHPRIDHLTVWDWLLGAVSCAAAIYMALNGARYAEWMSGFSEVERGDAIAGTILILTTIEICRRTVGWGLTSVIFVLLVYSAFGQMLTGPFRHPGITYDYFIEMQMIGTDGIFGSPLYVAASYAFLFVLFGNFYVISGGGQLFFDLGAALTGRMAGGPAKACVLSSGLYGSISGSPVADVATTGPVSIPIMKKIGIPAERAAAIEAAASTGGSMLPPVMGAVAFMMADFTGISYAMVCLYATLPALGYYFGIYCFVHFEAERLNLAPLEESQIVGVKVALQRNWSSVLPIIVLVWLLVQGYSAAYVAAGSVVSVIVASWFASREKRIGPKKFVEACLDTCLSSVPLAGSVAAAGLVIGCIELTGLSGKFTLLMFQLSGGYLISTLILSGIILVLLGLGMPTTGVYIMGVALLAPVLIGKFQLPVMPVHMFLLFYGCLSAITPPVAVANFAAAAIAGANPGKLSVYACKLAVGGFLLPFFFLFNPGIMLLGAWHEMIWHTAIGFILVFAAALLLHGYVVRRRLDFVQNTLLIGACALMLWPTLVAQAVGAVVAIVLFMWLRREAPSKAAI
jgi:TRAP transporter 4TM/12TM fusion protein